MKSAAPPTRDSVRDDAFAWMQARLVELLLRHDAPRFASALGERAAGPLSDPRVRRQRELAALWHLHGELLDGILPLIRRRLSFAAPRELRSEALPPRGRVDWPRTAAEQGRERPGEHPLEVRTRQRRRHFATPENLLVVATLLECRASAERLLETELARGGPAALRHPLREVVTACDRELGFPQLAGLAPEAGRLLAEGAEALDELEREAAATLPPGHSRAYDDLLAWRRRLAALRLADGDQAEPHAPALGADPAAADLLYRLWIFYETVDLLQRRGVLLALQDGGAGASFVWGEGDQRRRYRLAAGAEREARWANLSPVRTSLLIEREGAAELRDGDALVWREPGFVVEAAFGAASVGEAAAQTLARLQLAGERAGALLLAFGGEDRTSEHEVAPRPGADVEATGARLRVRQLRPAIGDERAAQAALADLLGEAHASIGPPVPVACHGVFLDALSAGERGALLGRDGAALPADDLLACPKPHVGPWRVDLVSRERHCCRDRRLCHIAGRAGARPPLRPPRSVEELLGELAQVVDRGVAEGADEGAVDAVCRRVEALTRRFAELAGDFGGIAAYEGRLRDAGMERTLHLLGAEERESLALASYLLDKLETVHATDFSAPTIHVARVLEREIQRRVMAIPGITAESFPHGKPTLGALSGTRRRRPEVWALIEAHVAAAWQGQVLPDDPGFAVSFDAFVGRLQPVVTARNRAAHTTPVTRDQYRELFIEVCRDGRLRVGALNALLLAWPVEF